MSYPDDAPILEFDPARDAVLEPHLAIEKFDLPQHVVLCFFRDTVAVARFRGVSFGQMLYAADDLSGEAWDARGWPHHETGRDLLLRLAAEAVVRIEPIDEPS